MAAAMTTDLFDLAVALLTIRRRTDVTVNIPDLNPAGTNAGWRAFLVEIEREIVIAGGESTTETADIGLVRRTAAYLGFVQDHPDLVQRVRTVTTIRESEDIEKEDH